MGEMKSASATATDAELIMKIYDLRREAKMREARDYLAQKFWPVAYEDLTKLSMAFGTQENAYFRQVVSYWEMAASFVVHGALDEALFFENCYEMWMIYAKVKPFLPRLREDIGMPQFMHCIEQVAEGSEEARARVAHFRNRIEKFVAAAAGK